MANKDMCLLFCIITIDILSIIFLLLIYSYGWYSALGKVPIVLSLFAFGIIFLPIFIWFLKKKHIRPETLNNESAKLYFEQMIETFRALLTMASFIIVILWGFKQSTIDKATPGTSWGYLKFQTLLIIGFVFYAIFITYLFIGTDLKKIIESEQIR